VALVEVDFVVCLGVGFEVEVDVEVVCPIICKAAAMQSTIVAIVICFIFPPLFSSFLPADHRACPRSPILSRTGNVIQAETGAKQNMHRSLMPGRPGSIVLPDQLASADAKMRLSAPACPLRGLGCRAGHALQTIRRTPEGIFPTGVKNYDFLSLS
jgi:hypothetical protein